jgi:hypothetical protein
VADEDVVWLEVAVDEAGAVGGGEAAAGGAVDGGGSRIAVRAAALDGQAQGDARRTPWR